MLGTKGLTDASRSPAHAGIAIFDGAFGHIQGDGHGKLGQAVVGVTDSGKSMIGNFLTSVWKRGGLVGAVPEDAFVVRCGLGETMTADDILEGILRVTVLVAVSRPAEFIEITFQQQMQQS